MTSHRVPADMEVNEFSRAVAEKRGTAIDLTETNPTKVGLAYPKARLEEILRNAGFFPYEPDPRGLSPARSAIADLRSKGGRKIRSDRLWLTSGTSEAYSFLTKLLADPGDEILIPTPSYPLFRHLLQLEGVRPVPYPLRHAEGWFIDFPALQEAIGPRTQGIVLVNPNNPTGHYVRDSEREELLAIAGRHSLPLIVDEVFLDFPLEGNPGNVSFAREGLPVPVFVLDGLSKLMALPQLKLSWVSLHGPEESVREIGKRLDWIEDLYLSVGTLVQRAFPELSGEAAGLAGMVGRRIGENHWFLQERFGSGQTIRYVSSEGGWSAILRLPESLDEEELVLFLARERDVVVQPGYFFDLPFRSSLVVSLLTQPARFREGIDTIVSAVEGMK